MNKNHHAEGVGRKQNKLFERHAASVLRVALVSACFFLSGCAQEFPNLTDEQVDRAGQYSAILLMKYDSENRRRLMSEEEIEKESARRASWEEAAKNGREMSGREETEPVNTLNEAEEKEEKEEKKQQAYGRLEDYFSFPEGLDIRYKDYQVGKSYPEDDSEFFSLSASEGKDLLILKFALYNGREGLEHVDLINQNSFYKVTVNHSYTRAQLPTLLENDLVNFQGSLLPGEERELVLLFEIDEGMDISSMTIRLKNESIEATILLK